VNEIIESYFAVRMKYYEYRHKLLLGEVNFNLQRVNSKLRFVTEIMNEQLVIYKKTRSQIIELLQSNNYPLYVSRFDPRTVLGHLYDQKDAVVATVKLDDIDSNDGGDPAGDAGGDEGNEENGQTGGGGMKADNPSYNYLLGMKIDSFSQEMLVKLQREVAELEDKLAKLNNGSPKSMWEDDLAAFEKEYIEWLKDWYDEKKLSVPDIKSQVIMSMGPVSRRAKKTTENVATK
jgi:DNA topoisomerase-2